MATIPPEVQVAAWSLVVAALGTLTAWVRGLAAGQVQLTITLGEIRAEIRRVGDAAVSTAATVAASSPPPTPPPTPPPARPAE